ncbi:hypothetical protein LSI54_05835 [Nesterenkonia sp. AY15]|uniref:hypothetical protein n=1 Tax=Nesterenkonia sp. AY15 TaxID=2901139 RepID=UPI001F4D122C|nr:hypothetical protein [Nesterenkonia sp. AY15]MCH8570881.1 hypothetical protein [Nesterenkonia sp. AY15]
MSARAFPNSTITPGNPTPQPVPRETHGHVTQEAAQRIRCMRYDQMAKAASAGLMAHPHVESAIVEISGDDAGLVFQLSCTINADSDPSDLMETISQGVISNIERMLGTEFASRRLHFNRSLCSAA